MSWYSVLYTRARLFRVRHPIIGSIIQLSFYTGVIFELTLYGFATYVYFNCVCRLLTNVIQAAIYSVIYVIISFMMFWSLVRVMFSKVARVPPQYKFDEESDARLRAVTKFNEHGRPILDCTEDHQNKQRSIMDNFASSKGLVLHEVDQAGRLRYCYECKVLKPDRTHHCSSCGFCVVRFDHHCPYVNSCVAFHNYKFFVLFLFYLEMWLIWSWVSSIEAIVMYFINYDALERLDIIIPTVVIVLLQAIASFYPLGELLRYHYLLISVNETTCEQAKIPNIREDRNATYDIGRWKNFAVVLGWGLWLVPVRTSRSDGLHHPINWTIDITTQMAATRSGSGGPSILSNSGHNGLPTATDSTETTPVTPVG